MSSFKTPNLVLLLLQAFYKSARVEWVPVGVVGAIVPWNWPFHNIINPISAAVMAGNAIVIKVSVCGVSNTHRLLKACRRGASALHQNTCGEPLAFPYLVPHLRQLASWVQTCFDASSPSNPNPSFFW